jgi:phosphoglycerate dehydrogenase-like enzyme
LWRLPNVILTPHIAGSDKGPAFPGRLADLVFQNVERNLRGQPLLNVITPQEWREA